jgi:hypothetical protein
MQWMEELRGGGWSLQGAEQLLHWWALILAPPAVQGLLCCGHVPALHAQEQGQEEVHVGDGRCWLCWLNAQGNQ